MNSRTVYSMMALSVIPGATMQAAVDVKSDVAVMSQSGKVTVNFGTLVPGKYTLQGMITTGFVNGMKITFNGEKTDLSSMTFVKDIELKDSTSVTLVVEGTSDFTLGTYMLKLNWNLDKTAWNTLISSVRTKVETTFSGKLTTDHQDGLKDTLDVKQAVITKLEDNYDTYKDYELWKLDGGNDVISKAIKDIETQAEKQVIKDCWDAKKAEYEKAIATVPTDSSINELSEKIDKLEVNKDKRKSSLDSVKVQIDTFKSQAKDALGNEPTDSTTWEYAIADEWSFNPNPTSDAINTKFSNLDNYVDTDIKNDNRYNTEMKGRVDTATTNIENVHPENTKNLDARAANDQEKIDIKNDLDTYKTEAQSAYDTATNADGVEFAYDSNYTKLTALEGRISALSAKITADSTAYASTYNKIKGYVTAATTYYNEQMAALTDSITEPSYAIKLEDAQGQLVAKKNAISKLGEGYASDYIEGKNLNAVAANDSIEAIKDEMDVIVKNTKTTIAGYRAKYKNFCDSIQVLTDSIDAKEADAKEGRVFEKVQSAIEKVDTLINQLQVNLDGANNSPYAIDDDDYAPKTNDGKTIKEVQEAIDKIDVATAAKELKAYNNAKADIAAAKKLLEDANEEIDNYNNDSKRTDYGKPSDYWKAENDSILASLEGKLMDVVDKQYADGKMDAYYNGGFATALDSITGEDGTIAKYIENAKSAIDMYRGFRDYFFTNCPDRLTTLTNAVKDLKIYDDEEVLFDAKTNYKAIIGNIQRIIDAAKDALTGNEGVIKLKGEEHLTELTRMCTKAYYKDNYYNEYSNYYTGALVKLADGTSIENRANTGGLANTLYYLRTDKKYSIASVDTLYNHTAFDNYKKAKKPTIDEANDSPRVKEVKNLIINQLDKLTYDDKKELAENKKEIDDIVEPYAEEAAAAEILDYINNLVSTNYKALNKLVVDSRNENSGKMGNKEDAFQEEYSNLLVDLQDIETDRNTINDAPIGEDKVDDPMTENVDESQFNDYNTNVEKVAAFSELLSKLGKSGDDVDEQGNGTLYAKYNYLDKRADAQVAAVEKIDSLYNLYTEKIAEYQIQLDAATTTIDGYSDWTRGQVAEKEEIIQGQINKAKKDLEEGKANETLTEATLEGITQISDDIKKLRADAAQKQNEWNDSENKYSALSTELAGLDDELSDTWNDIEQNYATVAKDFETEKNRIADLIDAARTKLEAARDSVTLAAETTLKSLMGEGYVDISTAINTMETGAQKKFQKVEAHNAIVVKYNEVNAALGEARTATVAAAGDSSTDAGKGAIAHYRDLFNGENGYAKQLAGIKDDYEQEYGNPELDNDKYKTTYINKLDSLKTAFDGVENKAADNKSSYDTQMVRYNKAKDLYDGYMADFATQYAEQTFVEGAKAKMEAYSWENGALKDALLTLEGFYTKGASVANAEKVTENISAIEVAMQDIKIALDGNEAEISYYLQVKAANDSTYSVVEAKIQEIRDAYNKAVKVLSSYTEVKDTILNGKIAAKSKVLNEAVFGAIQQITVFGDEAKDARDAATESKLKWDATELEGRIQEYVKGLNDAKNDFLDDCKADIKTFWDGVKTARQLTITSTFNTLKTNGYIVANEAAEEIFDDSYATIAQGDDYVYESENVVKKGVIDINGLDDLVFEGALAEATFAEAVQNTATAHAQKFVNAKIAEYDAKTENDLADILAIFTGHDVDYGKPDNVKGVKEQFGEIVSNTITPAGKIVVTYETDYDVIGELLDSYDTQIDDLKSDATQWVKDQKAADVALETAKSELSAAQETLKTTVESRQSEFEALSELINKSSVASKYEGDLEAIKKLIDNAMGVAKDTVLTTLTTLAAVDEAKANVTTQQDKMEGAGTGTPIFMMTSVKNGAIADLKNDLGLLIPDLMVQFNAYSASDGAVQETVDDWNFRIQRAITLTGTNSNPTLEEMVNLEDDLAKLRTEMGNLSGDVTKTIADFKSRTATLKSAALTEADYDTMYGTKAEDFAKRLSAIKTEAAKLDDEVAQHETAGDILPYVDILESHIKAQETAWKTLQGEAEVQAAKVATAKEIAKGFNSRVEALKSATLDGEYSSADTESLNYRLGNIKAAAESIALDIKNYGENIAVHEKELGDALNTQEQDLETLKNDAATAALNWAEAKTASKTAWETLNSKLNELEATILKAQNEIGGFTLTDSQKSFYLGQVANVQTAFDTKKHALEEKKAAFTLTQADVDDYTTWETTQQNALTNNALNPAARAHALALYTAEGCELDAAKAAAWDAYFNWTFAKNVKAEIKTALLAIDDDVTTFQTAVINDNDSYSKLESYAKTAADLIAGYNAQEEEIEGYDVAFGDANTDGKVNVLDYRTIANMILTPTLQPNAETQAKLFKAIDINQNEVIEVGDLTAVVNYILDADWQGWDVAAARGERAVNKESLTMGTSLTEHGTQRIAVSLNNVRDYTAFQLDVVLPEGMTIVGQQLSDRAAASHTLLSRAQQDGSIRFLASSIKGESFSGNSGAVLYIDVEGAGNVELMNILFSDLQSGTHAFTVGAGEATGIEKTGVIDSLKQQVYNLGGKLMNGMKKGINIIRRADGTVEKKFVK